MRCGCARFLLVLLLPIAALAQNLGFDLAGPPIDVRVERSGRTLPIAEVPNLAPGDRLWVHPDLPDSQSARYLLIVAFLRGSTNPPPESWFTRAETWNETVHQEGISVVVPDGAEQAVIFLAPQTAGDFSTLKAAVRGRPGAFVRAVQDLQQASFDRLRLERYLAEIKSTSDTEPSELQHRSTLLARSLKMKLDTACFEKPAEQQAACLTQNTDQLVLDDAHSQSMLAQLANGATADLMNQLSNSRLAGGGAYSAYVGAIVDFARIMGTLHSAQYQYIPALALPHEDSLSLKLNNPPSFRKPKSVLVVALPTVQKATPPPLRALSADERHCAEDPALLLPADGAPLVFATPLAHGLRLQVSDHAGHSVDLPARADPAQGGFVLERHGDDFAKFDADAVATLHGEWGFDSFQGPKFKLEVAHPQTWTVIASDQTALIVGREDSLHVSGRSLACVSGVSLRDSDGGTRKLDWKTAKADTLDIKLPLQDLKPGTVWLDVAQHGLPKPDEIALHAYAEAAAFDTFTLAAGDAEGTLAGKRLDEVSSLEVQGVRFEPDALERRNDHDELRLKTLADTAALPLSGATAHVTLKDGRSFSLAASVLPPRPKVTLISKGVQAEGGAESPIRLGSDDDLPTSGRIVFFLKTVNPARFARDEQIEVSATDGSFGATLSLSDGSLVLQDAQTALGILDPQKAFGASAFGPLQLRAIAGDGRKGDWLPLGTLIRLPSLKELRCSPTDPNTCLLTGANLFLVTAISTDPDFEHSTSVPDGFTGQTFPIARPKSGTFYFKLRDDPEVMQTATLPVVRGTLPSASSARTRPEPPSN